MNEILKRSLVSIWKILIGCFLVYLTVGLLTIKSVYNLWLGLGLLFLFTLPTIFVVYFKKGFVAKHPSFSKIWKFLRILYVFFIILFVAIFAGGYYLQYEKIKTQQTIDFINSVKITMDDVVGKNLPPEPDQKLNDSTISGIDANHNYIRDDVELAIFKKYPDSAKIRAAELQYAQALQLELTQVFNSDTLVAAIQKGGLAYMCLSGISKDDKSSIIKEMFDMSDQRIGEVDDFVLNTNLRKEKNSDIYKKYMTGYGSKKGPYCDIDITTLPN
jgi:hypothetical protein